MQQRSSLLDRDSSQPIGAADPRAPRGLVEELLEARLVARDFSLAEGTVRVETRIKISRRPWTMRSVVLENGVEISAGPFAAVEDSFDPDSEDPDELEALKLTFARQVLEGHQARCRDVERTLGGAAAPKGAGRRGGLVAVAAALVIAGIAAAGYFLGPGKKHLSAGSNGTSAPSPAAPAEALEGRRAEDQGGEMPEPPPPPVRKGSLLKEAAKTASPQAQRPAAGGQGSARRKPVPRDEAPAKKDRPLQESLGNKELLANVEPATYRLGWLRPGAEAYSDEAATFAEVPASYRGLRCVRTASADRVAAGSIAFDLDREGKVLVGHDPRIKKKPRWLQGFSRTGRRLTLAVVGQKRPEVPLDLFARDYPAGRVVLGPNTEWNALTRRFREKVPKELNMYVVCVTPADG